MDGLRRAEEAHANAGLADAAIDDDPRAVDAVDPGTHGRGEGVVAEERGAVGPADLSTVGVAGEADIGPGGDGGMEQVGIMQEHEFEIARSDVTHRGGDVGVDAAVLVDADEGDAGRGRFFGRLDDGEACGSALDEDCLILQQAP